MGNVIRHKRSSTTTAEPLTTDLELGELAINTYDGKLFLKKNDGADAIVEIGGGGEFAMIETNNLVGGTGAGLALTAAEDFNFIAGYGAGGDAQPDFAVIIGNNTGYYSDSLRSVTIGYGAGYGASANRITGDDNVTIGYDALRNATTAYNTTAVGANALKGTGTTPLTGVFNCAFGYNAGQIIQGAAARNAILGSYAGSALTTGSFNTFVGVQAGNIITTGSSNTIVGQNAGSGLGTTATGNVIIGRTAGPTTSQSNQLWIHNAQSDTPLIHGNFSTGVVTINGDFSAVGAITADGGVDSLTSATTVVDVAAATAPTVGQVLTATSSTAATWQDAGGASPGGSDTYMQYNDGGAFGGVADFTFDDATIGLLMSNSSATYSLRVQNTSASLYRTAIEGSTTGEGGTGVSGRATGTGSWGVYAYNGFSGAAEVNALYATTASLATGGIAAKMKASATSGSTFGAHSTVSSIDGTAGYFLNDTGTNLDVLLGEGTNLIRARVGSIERFKVDNTGRVYCTHNASIDASLYAYNSSASNFAISLKVNASPSSTGAYGIQASGSGANARVIYSSATGAGSTCVYGYNSNATGIAIRGDAGVNSGALAGSFTNSITTSDVVEIGRAADFLRGTKTAVEQFKITNAGVATFLGGVDKLTSATTAVDVSAATAPEAGQVLTATSSTAATWQHKANPNIIINGNLDVDQRAFPSTAIADAAAAAYAADRFLFYNDRDTGAATLSRSTDVPTYAQSGVHSEASLDVTITTALASPTTLNEAVFGHLIEGYDYRMIAGGDATLSFWVKSNLTGTYSVAFKNSGNDRYYVTEYTISSASTWEKKTVTVPMTETGGTWDYDNGWGLSILFAMMSGATPETSTLDAWTTGNKYSSTNQVNLFATVSNFFRIAQVKMEEGAVATPMKLNNRAEEVCKCQRYYNNSYTLGVAPAATSTAGLHAGTQGNPATGEIFTTIHYPVEMRAQPTVKLYAEDGTADVWRNRRSVSNVAVTATALSTKSASVSSSVGLQDDVVRGHYTATAE